MRSSEQRVNEKVCFGRVSETQVWSNKRAERIRDDSASGIAKLESPIVQT